MVEEEVDFVKVQPRAGGTFMVTIPKAAIKELGVSNGERVKVLLDPEKRRVIYQF